MLLLIHSSFNWSDWIPIHFFSLPKSMYMYCHRINTNTIQHSLIATKNRQKDRCAKINSKEAINLAGQNLSTIVDDKGHHQHH